MTVVPRLHLITDDAVVADPRFLDTADAVLERCGGSVALHLRGHDTSAARLYAAGERLVAAAGRTGSWLIVNDRVDIARAVRATGVQLGRRSLSIRDARTLLGQDARIGCSVHDVAEAVHAGADGADYIVLGTIYASMSHPEREPAGIEGLRRTAARSVAPVVAIGGITPERTAEAAAAGAHGIAVLSGVWRQTDPVGAAVRYTKAVHDAWPETGRKS